MCRCWFGIDEPPLGPSMWASPRGHPLGSCLDVQVLIWHWWAPFGPKHVSLTSRPSSGVLSGCAGVDLALLSPLPRQGPHCSALVAVWLPVPFYLISLVSLALCMHSLAFSHTLLGPRRTPRALQLPGALFSTVLQIAAAPGTQNSDFCFPDLERPLGSLGSPNTGLWPGNCSQEERQATGLSSQASFCWRSWPCETCYPLLENNCLVFFVRFDSCLQLKNNPGWLPHHRQLAVFIYFYLSSKYFLSVYNVGGITNTGWKNDIILVLMKFIVYGKK